MPSKPKTHRISKGKSHKDELRRKRDIKQAKIRQSKRMYNTGSKAWQSIRNSQLSQYPLCADCLDKGLTRSANVVDHIDGNSWNNDPSNLQSLCSTCHNRKTALYDGGFGRKTSKTHTDTRNK
ncbi:MAG: HNH endonuclease [Proteobacteria bacterium]|nr:MAG: HNH endonuclease [Pseudomonadota bacterium]